MPEGEEVLIGKGIGGGGEAVLALLEHVLGVSSGEVAGLGLEVEEDGIRLPVTQHMDGSFINTRYEEGCDSTRSEAVGFNPFWWDGCW